MLELASDSKDDFVKAFAKAAQEFDEIEYAEGFISLRMQGVQNVPDPKTVTKDARFISETLNRASNSLYLLNPAIEKASENSLAALAETLREMPQIYDIITDTLEKKDIAPRLLAYSDKLRDALSEFNKLYGINRIVYNELHDVAQNFKESENGVLKSRSMNLSQYFSLTAHTAENCSQYLLNLCDSLVSDKSLSNSMSASEYQDVIVGCLSDELAHVQFICESYPRCLDIIHEYEALEHFNKSFGTEIEIEDWLDNQEYVFKTYNSLDDLLEEFDSSKDTMLDDIVLNERFAYDAKTGSYLFFEEENYDYKHDRIINRDRERSGKGEDYGR